MMLLFLPLGLLPPTIVGWVTLRLIEGRSVVLQRSERLALGCLVGLTATMFLTFLAAGFLNLPLTLWGFLIMQGISLLLVFAAWFRRRPALFPASPPLAAPVGAPRWMRILLFLLLAWTIVKIIVAGVTFLLLTPTYLDDSLDNWNLRAKVFFHTEELTLVMPHEDPETSPRDISSYPPTVPLAKTWMTVLAREWSEPLINSIHLVWLVIAFTLLYFSLRRYVGVEWSMLGVYVLGSMPLYLMHGTNPYADVFLSSHIFAAVSFLFHFFRSNETERSAYGRLAGLCVGLLPFTKNEGLLLYLPPLLLIFAVGLFLEWRKNRTNPRQLARYVLWYMLPLLLILIPWLMFKWSRGLTFGNAKPFTSLGFSWQENVLFSVAVNTFFEANWLLLFPLLLGLLLWRFRKAFGTYLPLTAYFLILYVGQFILYLFTGLSTEAVLQTGYARGLVHLLPMIVMLTIFLLRDGASAIRNTLARSDHLQTHLVATNEDRGMLRS